MSQINQDIATILKANGLSVTKQRLIVFELLEGKEPVSMNELYKVCESRLDRASLYRIINTYEELGIVHRINYGWKYKLELSDKFAEHHHHLTCKKCGSIIPINESQLEQFVEAVSLAHNFNPTEHQVEVQGYCQKCR
jgi:Fur family ferric uptake transcriptional regulator